MILVWVGGRLVQTYGDVYVDPFVSVSSELIRFASTLSRSERERGGTGTHVEGEVL